MVKAVLVGQWVPTPHRLSRLYAGLAKSAWCIRLKDDHQPQPQAGQIHAMMLLELGYAKACVSLFNFNVKTPFVLLQQYVGLLGQQF